MYCLAHPCTANALLLSLQAIAKELLGTEEVVLDADQVRGAMRGMGSFMAVVDHSSVHIRMRTRSRRGQLAGALFVAPPAVCTCGICLPV